MSVMTPQESCVVNAIRITKTLRLSSPNGQFLPYMHNMIATPAWNKLHKEGKTNDVTGRFFRPRPSEEFYDNEVDFDNVNNLIDAPEHQEKIAELRGNARRNGKNL